MRNMTFWVLMLVLIAGGASAQPSPRVKATRKGATKVTVGKRLDTLKTRVDRLDALGVDIPALLETLRGLQREVSTLKRMMAAKKTVIREYKVLRLQVEALDERLGDLELRLSAVTLCTAAPEEIFSDGLSLRALQGKLELHVRGLLQGEYEGIIATTRRVFSGSSIGEHGSAFMIARARLALAGHVIDPRLRFRLGVEAGQRAEHLLLDATASFHWHRMLWVALGLQRVPFGRQYAMEISSMRFRDRSPVTEAFYPGRDIGILVGGDLVDSDRFGRLSYQAGVFNGAGPRGGEFRDDNTDFLYAARMTYEPLGTLGAMESDGRSWTKPHLAIGASFFYNLVATDIVERTGERDPLRISHLRDQDGDGENDNVGIMGINAELAIRWRGLSWQSELFYRREDPGAVANARRFWGTYTQVGVAHHRLGLEIAARYSFWELARYGEDGTVVAPARIHETAMTGGVWLFQRRLRLQASYAHRWLRGLQARAVGPIVGDTLGEHRIYVQTQVSF